MTYIIDVYNLRNKKKINSNEIKQIKLNWPKWNLTLKVSKI